MRLKRLVSILALSMLSHTASADLDFFGVSLESGHRSQLEKNMVSAGLPLVWKHPQQNIYDPSSILPEATKLSVEFTADGKIAGAQYLFPIDTIKRRGKEHVSQEWFFEMVQETLGEPHEVKESRASLQPSIYTWRFGDVEVNASAAKRGTEMTLTYISTSNRDQYIKEMRVKAQNERRQALEGVTPPPQMKKEQKPE